MYVCFDLTFSENLKFSKYSIANNLQRVLFDVLPAGSSNLAESLIVHDVSFSATE